MKSLLLTMLTVCSLSTLTAQTVLKPAIGLNFTDWSKNDATGEFKARAGWQIGGTVEFGNKLYFEPGIFYVGRKTEFVSSDQSFDDFDADLNGIRVPVSVGLRLIGNPKGLLQVRGFGGVSGFFLTSVGDDFDKDDFEKSSFGLFAGAGVDIWRIFVDASYEWSLSNIQKDVQDVDVGKTRTLFINAGIRLNLK